MTSLIDFGARLRAPVRSTISARARATITPHSSVLIRNSRTGGRATLFPSAHRTDRLFAHGNREAPNQSGKKTSQGGHHQGGGKGQGRVSSSVSEAAAGGQPPWIRFVEADWGSPDGVS